MNTLICRTCGCSLVRLGIRKQDAPGYRHAGEEHRFCCQGCVDLFVTDPDKHLQETSDVIVCPTCLGEKPTAWAVSLNVGGRDLYFCRCPYCVELFKKNPDFYMGRWEGTIENRGVLDHEGCCIRPD